METFGVEVNFEPVITGVHFGVPPQYVNKLPKGTPLSRVFFVDLNKKSKISVADYMEGFRKDPKLTEKLSPMNVNDAINRYDYRVPCDPGIGFVVEPDGMFIPLVEIIFKVEHVRAEYSVPLKHMDVDGQRVHLGDTDILGLPTKLVLYEMPGKLKVMFEQRMPRQQKDAGD
ncbi:MAG: hypothetical protein WC626_13990, partial [Methanoregula sp.]